MCQNRPPACTLSDKMQVQHMSKKNTRDSECRNVSVFGKTFGVHGCPLTHEFLQHEESQIRQEHSFVFFSEHVRSLTPVPSSENEMKSVSSLHPSAEAVNFECTLLNNTLSTEESSLRSRLKLCQLIDAGPLAERRR